jgi:hypothetical protein
MDDLAGCDEETEHGAHLHRVARLGCVERDVQYTAVQRLDLLRRLLTLKLEDHVARPDLVAIIL